MKRRTFIHKTGAAALATLASRAKGTQAPPNVVLILADDLGYRDLGCYGSSIQTPNLNRTAQEGVRFEQFYSANPVCSPSRASILTGRYGVRGGVPAVLFPDDTGGLAPTEMTIAQMLKPLGYKLCASASGTWVGPPIIFRPAAGLISISAFPIATTSRRRC